MFDNSPLLHDPEPSSNIPRLQDQNKPLTIIYSPLCENPETLLRSLLSQTPPPYQLTVPLDDLLGSRKRPNGTIPSPKNAFMIYRIDLSARLRQIVPEMTVGEVSGLASQAWKHQSQSVLQFFEVMSMVAKQRHRILTTSPTPPTTISNSQTKPQTSLTSTPPTLPTPLTTPLTPFIPFTPPTPFIPSPTPILNSSEDNLDWIRYNSPEGF
ncbi:4026_t:CDS:1 [Funneliformis mosseae]|uniref:4026_t:CDS:1 n=1 Tax=Funneliformis mosseae TaxID=27381 RepID=A0A9N8WAR5_FUNMO|nr:4026_t:CDS:1 [Funneliformis mosseae]